MKHKLIIFLSFFISYSGFSQELKEMRFSLQEAIDYALENNKKAKGAALDIKAARQQKWETTATGLPQINLNAEYQNFIQQAEAFLPAILLSDQLRNDLGLSVTDQFPAVFGTQQNASATITLNQLIFDGSYIVGLQSAKVFLEISKNAKEKTDLEVRKSVINAYGNVLLAEESLKILGRNIEVLQKNLDETKKIYESGFEEEESVEQLQITLSGLKSNLNNTARLKNLSYQMLNINLGLDVDNPTIISDNLQRLTSQNIVLSLLSAEDNIAGTIDYRIAENDRISKELLLKLEKSKALPKLSAFVNGGYTGGSQSFTFFDRSQEWFGSSLFGLSLNVPIFSSGGRNAATQRARVNLEKAEADLKDIEQKVKLQIASAKSSYQFAIEDYENKKQNLNLAERIEKKNQTKFFEGIASSFELRQAQTQLYTSQQDFLQSMLNVITQKTELETVLNEIPKN